MIYLVVNILPTRFKTSVLKSALCNYIDEYVVAKGKIIVRVTKYTVCTSPSLQGGGGG